jgi:hypothetical protein
MPYREPDDTRDLDLDARELDAATALGQRCSGLETRVLFVAVVLGVIAGVPGWFVVQELQFRLIDAAFLYANALGFIGPVLGSALLGRHVARLLMRQRMPAWLDELARVHQLPRARLDELVRSLRAL